MAESSHQPSMAELKHRMLYQGQDPSQLVLRPSRQGAPIADPQQPPAYDDAIGQNAATLRQSNPQPHNAHRSTFIAEPQHLRTQLEQPRLLRSERHELDEQPTQQLPIEGQQSSQPQVRSFFASAPQPQFGLQACPIVCPVCGKQGHTRLQRTVNMRAHCWAHWLCLFGWCCCACWYPYIMDSCRITRHYCNACKTFLGAYHPKDCCH